MEQDPGVPGPQLTTAPILPAPDTPQLSSLSEPPSRSPHFCRQRRRPALSLAPSLCLTLRWAQAAAGPGREESGGSFAPESSFDCSPLLCWRQSQNFRGKQDPSPPSIRRLIQLDE